jgi:hypothetical protein
MPKPTLAQTVVGFFGGGPLDPAAFFQGTVNALKVFLFKNI